MDKNFQGFSFSTAILKNGQGSLDLNTKDSVSLKPGGNLHTLRQGRASAHRAAHFSSLQCSHDS